MRLYDLAPADLQIASERETTLGEAISGGFTAVRETMWTTENKRQREIEDPLTELVVSVTGQGFEFSPETQELLFKDPAEMSDNELQSIYSEAEAFGVEIPDAARPDALRARREESNAALFERVSSAEDLIGRAGPVKGTFGALVGGVGASFTDPVNLATIPFAAPARAGLLTTMAVEAGINAAIEAGQTPGRNTIRREVGLEEESLLMNVTVGALFGGLLPAGVRGAQVGGKRLAPLASDLATRIGRMIPSRELARVAAQASRSDDPELRGVGEAVRNDLDDMAAAIENPENNAALMEHTERAQQAREAAEGNADLNMPDRPVAANSARTAIINGEIEEVNPLDLRVMPDLFQFKSEGVGPEGVTGALSTVRTWDPGLAGITYVYEFSDGTRAIADGHQRTNLAKRIMADDPSQNIRLAARVFREEDGFTPEYVRARAAAKNVSENKDGMTVAMARDAARVMRSDPALFDNLPFGPGIARAQNLAKLSDDAFQLLINDVLPDRQGELIGRLVQDPSLHVAMVRLLERTRPTNMVQAESIVQQALQAPVQREVTEDLFGAQEVAESLYMERAKVLDRAMRLMRDDRSVFRTLTEREARIQGTGENRLDSTSNEQQRKTTEMALEAISRLAHRAGPISEALNDGAKAYKESGRIKDAAEKVVAAVNTAIARGDLDGGTGRVGRQDAQSTSEGTAPSDPNGAFAEPLGQGAQDQIANTRDALESTAPPEPRASGIVDQMTADGRRVVIRKDDLSPQDFRAVDNELRSRQPGDTPEEYWSAASRNHDALNDEAQSIADGLGLTFFRAPVKTMARMMEKVTDKYGGDHKRVGDVARAGVTVDTPEDAAAFIAALGRRFHIIDEGWSETPAGYFDAKLMVRFDDGTVGEFQMWPPGMFDAKENRGGHAMYEEARLPETPPERVSELEAQMRELYGSTLSELDASWSRFGGGVAPSSSSTRASSEGGTSTARSSDSTARAVASEGSDQAPLDGTQTDARLRTDDAAARLDTSNRTSFMGDTSTADIGNNGRTVNTERTSAGDQTLFDGVAPITDAQRLQQRADQPLGRGAQRASDTQIGGLFDPLDPSRVDLFDAIPVGIEKTADGQTRAVTRSVSDLREELEADDEFVAQLGLCLK